MAKYIAIFVLILVVVISVAGFWYWQSNQYSKEILKLEILGPEKLTTGEEVEYILKLKNNGKVRLEDVELSFEYPENVIPETNREQRVVESLEDIYPGEERILTFKGIAFGVEKDVLEAKVLVIYRLKNLKAPYDRETTFLSQISQVPLTFEFDLPLKTEQGVKMDFSLNYFSNINYILENLRVKIIYPNGFTFLNS